MNRDEFRAMLEESGVHKWYVSCNQDWTELLACLERFAAAEREACAKILDANANTCHDPSVLRDILMANAAAIRARGAAPEGKQ